MGAIERTREKVQEVRKKVERERDWLGQKKNEISMQRGEIRARRRGHTATMAIVTNKDSGRGNRKNHTCADRALIEVTGRADGDKLRKIRRTGLMSPSRRGPKG